jgi:lipid-A-disaccharide synthase
MQADIIIISNAPGELAAWVRPVVGDLRKRYPEARITVALVPCPYASGREAESLRSWNLGLDVWGPAQTLRYLLTGSVPGPSAEFGDRGVVLFLGGDQFFGVLMARRTGLPLLVYTETTGRWPWAVDRFLLSDRTPYLNMRNRRVPPSKVSLVGNLMVDSVETRFTPAETRQRLKLSCDSLVVGLLPGSKPFKVLYITPFLLRVAELLRAHDPSLQFVLHQSPFTPLAQLEKAITEPRYAAATGGTLGRLAQQGGENWIITIGGCPVRIVPAEYQYDAMAVDDLALTVPGTNTAELAVLGVPQVVVLPLNKPEEIPLDGLLGRIGGIPILGKWIKRGAIGYMARRLGFTALPNRRMGRMVTPELVGVLTPEDVCEAAAELLDDHERRRQVKLDLLQAMGYKGAAATVSAVIGEVVARGGSGEPSEVAAPGSDPSA